MSPATEPRPLEAVRLLVVDGPRAAIIIRRALDLPSLLHTGDLVVVNDAATLPASIVAHTTRGARVEIRLVASRDGARLWTAALLGDGDWRTGTEDRPAPPSVDFGDRFRAHGRLVIDVVGRHAVSRRLLDVSLGLEGREHASDAEVWAAIYAAGRPVQYAHVSLPLALWDVQNVYAARPWAVEMPSAGRAITTETLLELRKRGIGVARVTEAAGLSAVGDAAIDASFPVPERFEVLDETVRAIAEARRRGGRVIAIGTSVVRALESAARDGTLRPTEGVTDMRLGASSKRRVVDAVLSGVHESDTTHYGLLQAFVSEELLARSLRAAVDAGFVGHEFGDTVLVCGDPVEDARVTPGEKVEKLGPHVLVGPETRRSARPATQPVAFRHRAWGSDASGWASSARVPQRRDEVRPRS